MLNDDERHAGFFGLRLAIARALLSPPADARIPTASEMYSSLPLRRPLRFLSLRVAREVLRLANSTAAFAWRLRFTSGDAPTALFFGLGFCGLVSRAHGGRAEAG